MKIKYFKIYVPLLFLVSIIFLWSCEEEEAKPSEVVLFSYGPTGAQHGDTIAFIGQNLLQVDTIEFGGSVMVLKESFASQTDNKIEVVVPGAAEAGKVLLHTLGGNIETKTALNFVVSFTVMDITQKARPGATVTIHGDFLNWVGKVVFSPGLEVTDFEKQTQTELVVEVPLEALAGPLTLKGGGTVPLNVKTSDFAVTLPSVTALSPASIRHSGELTLEGSDLDLIKEVVFPDGSVVSNFASVSSTALVLKVPNTATNGKLTLITKYTELEVETSDALAIILPKESDLSPSPLGIGEELTITGTDLDLVASLVFPAVSTPVTAFVSQSATAIKVIVPEGCGSGFMKFVTIHDFEVNLSMELQLSSGPAPLLYALYDDAMAAGWQDWGWGGATDWASTELVFDGGNSIKKIFDAYGAVRWSQSSVDVSGYDFFVFYAYGGEGITAETNMNLVVDEEWGSPYIFTILPGEWKEVIIPIADVNGGLASWIDVILQDQLGAVNTVYFDYVGFR